MSCSFWNMRRRKAAALREQKRLEAKKNEAVEPAQEAVEPAQETETIEAVEKPARKRVTKNDGATDSES